ncbi:hypothetical protein [Planktotalea sp.]|uniref:tetratricopeptide repeat protein n=1 Tax=Planktotalea sp. TaxID=2029877 RepID=UPI003296C886
MFRSLTLIAALALTPMIGFAQSLPLKLDFLPPTLAPRDLCNAPAPTDGVSDFRTEGGKQELTNVERIGYLRSDIQRYMNADANQYFAFVNALITQQSLIDESFTNVDAIFARIDLMLRAGQGEQLREQRIVASLRERASELTNGQRVKLALFYEEGIGVAPDPLFSQELIREAAYAGSALALLEIARLAGQGILVEGWDAPLDLTVTMAFGGILGPLDRSVCQRAERIAQEYIKGDLVAPNPSIALAWYKFAADMGGSQAAWRIVEFHLNADAKTKNNVELRRYLDLAVRLGVTVDDASSAALVASGAVSENELAAILGFNFDQDKRRTRAAIAPYLDLVVNIDSLEPDEDSLLLDYLWEITKLPEAPGNIYTRLAAEILGRKGRWAGEAEAMPLLEEAARRGDGLGQRRLANMLLRYRDDPVQLARTESLLMEAVSRHGLSVAMNDLDSLYRCRTPDAPRLRLANEWAQSYAASERANVSVSGVDLLSLSPDRDPEVISLIQSLALDRRSQMVAAHAQRVQSNTLAANEALQFWADMLSNSSQALELFAKYEFSLAQSPAQRDLAVEFFRRVYLNNGVATALDLAVALVEYNARDPEIAEEIVQLLTMAGRRGEGGAIRLLSRLQSGVRSEAAVYAQFADSIEKRGDFLAMMFALPHVPRVQVDDYVDRAVSLMSCTSKDVEELASAHAKVSDQNGAFHWHKIALNIDGGHALSKLGLSDRQTGLFDKGAAPDPVARAQRSLAEGDPNALMRLIQLTSNPGLPSYNADAASRYFETGIEQGDTDRLVALAAIYRASSDEVRRAIDARVDMDDVLLRVARGGDVAAAYALGMRLRDTAKDASGLAQSLSLLEAAALRGHRDAMYETGFALGFGLGRAADVAGAIKWLEQAATVGHPDAGALAKSLRIAGGL